MAAGGLGDQRGSSEEGSDSCPSLVDVDVGFIFEMFFLKCTPRLLRFLYTPFSKGGLPFRYVFFSPAQE